MLARETNRRGNRTNQNVRVVHVAPLPLGLPGARETLVLISSILPVAFREITPYPRSSWTFLNFLRNNSRTSCAGSSMIVCASYWGILISDSSSAKACVAA